MKGQKKQKKQRIPKPVDFQPEEFFPDDHKTWPGKRRCTAWNSNHGRQCGKPAKKGKTKCERDGGNSPSGINSPNLKTGIWSKDYPIRWAGRIAELEERQLRLSLEDSIYLLQAMIGEQLANLSGPPATELWKQTQKTLDKAEKAYRQLSTAEQSDSTEKYLTAKDELGQALKGVKEAIEAGLSEAAGEDKVRDLLEQLRRFIDNEHKMQTDREFMLRFDEARLMLSVQAKGYIQIIEQVCSPEQQEVIFAQMSKVHDRLFTSNNKLIIEG